MPIKLIYNEHQTGSAVLQVVLDKILFNINCFLRFISFGY